MPTKPLKGCNLSNFLLQQCLVSRQPPGRSLFLFHVVALFELFHELNFIFVAQSEPFLQNKMLIFLEYGPPSGGERASYVTADLSYD